MEKDYWREAYSVLLKNHYEQANEWRNALRQNDAYWHRQVMLLNLTVMFMTGCVIYLLVTTS